MGSGLKGELPTTAIRDVPGTPPLSRRQADGTQSAGARSWYPAQVDYNRKSANTVTYETVEVFGDENRVTETGTVVARVPSGKVACTEKYMAIWEKRKGKWQVIREIYNHDSKAR